MSIKEIADSLIESERLERVLADIAIFTAMNDLPAIQPSGQPPQINWSYALRSASALAPIQTEAAQDAALRIAQGCLLAKKDDSIEEGHRTAASLILERMGNRRTLRLAEKRDLLESAAWKSAPAPLALDVIRRRLELALPDPDGGTFPANQFQRDFWTLAKHADWISMSAPTSAGKSYIVRRWFEERILGADEFRAAYIVPTRALIDEVSRSLAEAFKDRARVSNIPWDEEIGTSKREIFVFTQERMHFLQQRDPSVSVQLLFVDEAQKFADGERGVLLQRVVAEAVRRDSSGQVIFASPLSDNPQLLLEGHPKGAISKPLLSETITVNQNLLWVDEVQTKAKTWTVDLIRNKEPHRLGEIELDGRPTDQMKRLSLVAVALGRHHSGNLVYVNSASDAERAAKQITAARAEEVDLSGDPEVAKLKELISKTIDRRYRLLAALDAGVAFHYGNMPLLVRAKIEDLFRSEVLSYLVCTSTLLEGVNLPCSNLFVRGPKKGRETFMEPSDFWNLAGRAGRWGHEFQGNIVCIDTRDKTRWPTPPVARIRQPLHRATDAVLDDLPALRRYIADDDADESTPDERKQIEPVFSLLASRISQNEPLSLMAGTGKLKSAQIVDLEADIREVLKEVEIPSAIYRRHAGISPVAMQQLLEHFRQHARPDELPLALPETRESEKNYLAALSRVRNHLGAPFSAHGGYLHSRAILMRDWMKGKALPVLISERIRFEEKQKPDQNKETLVAAAIRNTMRDVEQFVRFEAPKYLNCYADVLDFFLESEGSDIEVPEMDLPMMLEMGVSRPTELALMTLGLSRASAIALEDYMIGDALTREACLQWLRDQDRSSLDVPALVKEEIADVVARSSAVEP